jgi:preprotein translocase subunit SecY
MAGVADTFRRLWRTPELRRDILFVLGILAIFRLLAHVPIPGVNPGALRQLFAGNQLLGLLNVFSGGGLQNLSVVMLGVGPYITASIIFQLLTMAVPRLERMQKEEGEAGRQKINQWTRLATVPLAVLQAYSFIALLRGQSGAISDSLSAIPMGLAIAVVSAGTMLLMWLGELISERKLGNGISLIIFAGIVASLPRAVQQTISVYDPSQLFDIILFLVVALVTIVGVVYVTEAQRNIPVSYARSIRGAGGYGGNSTYLPLRVNMAGVIPIIFAVSLVLFPPTLAKFLQQASSPWLRHAAESVISLFANQAFYAALYGLLVFGFTYFYTYVVFQPKQVSENLQKQGGFIPGIRPGPHTADYLQYVTNRILLAGAAFLAAIAVLPTILRSSGGVSGSLVVGGTSVLIVVSVVIETIRQIQSQLVMRDYEKL